jgi:arylsulfatase A-like enzyme
MAGKTIEWLHSVRANDTSKPWFTYFSTGCSHAPHQVPAEWADRYKGAFDQGGTSCARRPSSGRSGSG